jgi:2-C-methyl-D-erythritol 4-phosphate cytidylyltransferase
MTQDLGVVLPCAGSGTRLGAARPKQFLDLGGRPVFHRSLTTFLAHPRVCSVALVVASSEIQQVRVDLGLYFGGFLGSGRLSVVEGGAERWESVRNGVASLSTQATLVAVHDVARPFLVPTDIDVVVSAAMEDGAATLALPAVDTIKRAGPDAEPQSGLGADGRPLQAQERLGPLVETTLDRKRIWMVQTPQAFRREVLERCYRDLAREPGLAPTDEAGLAETFGHSVRLVRGAERLRKITSAEDLEWARWMVSRKS